MRLQRITWIENDEQKVNWAGSLSAASSKRKLLRQRVGYVPNSVQTQFIDVPTKKDGLLRILNEYAV